MVSTAKYNPIQSVVRAMTLLEYIGAEGQGKGITHIAQHMGLHKSTCFGLLHTLQQLGYVTQDKVGKYSLGLRAFQLGSAYLAGLDVRNVARPYLMELRDLSSETVHLVLREGYRAVYIEKIEGPRAMTISSRVGHPVHMYCSGVGKAILAFMPPADLQKALAVSRAALTKYTIVDLELLQNQLQKIRQQGYALDEQEIEIGLFCLAAPFFDSSGQVIGGISIAGPESRFTKARIKELIPRIKEAARLISKHLGYRQGDN